MKIDCGEDKFSGPKSVKREHTFSLHLSRCFRMHTHDSVPVDNFTKYQASNFDACNRHFGLAYIKSVKAYEKLHWYGEKPMPKTKSPTQK